MEFGEKTDDSEFLNNLGFTGTDDHLEVACMCLKGTTQQSGKCYRHKGAVAGSPFLFPSITFHPSTSVASAGGTLYCYFPGVQSAKIAAPKVTVKKIDTR